MARTPTSTALVVASLAGALLLAACDLVPEQPMVTAVPPGPGPGAPGDHGMEPAYTPDPSEEWTAHTFEDLGVVIDLPLDWFAVEGELARVEGGSGFVNLTPADSGTGDVRDLCRAEADHKMQPYGSAPLVTFLEVDGQLGCRIDPSADQLSEGNWWGAVVVTVPRPMLVSGVHYPMLVVTADLGHLDAVQHGLRFV